MGENWQEKEKETDESKLILHIGSHEPDTLPAGVQMLTCGIDVQLDHVWYSVHGWGYLSECWQICEGRIETGDTRQIGNYVLVEKFLHTAWPFADDKNKTLSITIAGIDTGYRGDIVIDFCRQCTSGNVVPIKGSGPGRYDIFTAVKIAGGTMIRYDLNVNGIKNRIYRLLYESSTPGPGFMHLHKNTSKETLLQLASEHQIPQKISRRKSILVWVPKTGYSQTHLWDTDVYSFGVAEIAGVRMIRELSAMVHRPTNKTEKDVQTNKGIRTKY
jgi:phage terminase large subunit GpA-like protein